MTTTFDAPPARRRVVLIDDNRLTLDGYAATLGRHCAIELVAAIDHDAALKGNWPWPEIDVVVLDAADEDRPGDQYPGVRVVRHIRAAQDDHRPIIVVVTGHFFDDGLRHRMAAADADFFFLRPEVRSPEKLTDIVLNPQHYRRGVPAISDKEQPRALGVTRRSQLEDMVGYVEANGLESTLNTTEPLPSATTRRSLMRHRRGLAQAGRITPVNLSTGTQPGENQHDPSIRQLRRLWLWAARVKYPQQDTWTETPR